MRSLLVPDEHIRSWGLRRPMLVDRRTVNSVESWRGVSKEESLRSVRTLGIAW